MSKNLHNAEVELKMKLHSNWLWQPNVALSSNQNLDFFFERDGILKNLGKTKLAYSPNLVAASAILFVPTVCFQVGFLSKYVGEQYMGNIDSEKSILSSYLVNDLNLVYSWLPKKWINEIQWSLLINNIFDNNYSSYGGYYTFDLSEDGQAKTYEGTYYYPQSGINLLLGIDIKF